jgi:hypothetical protein
MEAQRFPEDYDGDRIRSNLTDLYARAWRGGRRRVGREQISAQTFRIAHVYSRSATPPMVSGVVEAPPRRVDPGSWRASAVLPACRWAGDSRPIAMVARAAPERRTLSEGSRRPESGWAAVAGAQPENTPWASSVRGDGDAAWIRALRSGEGREPAAGATGVLDAVTPICDRSRARGLLLYHGDPRVLGDERPRRHRQPVSSWCRYGHCRRSGTDADEVGTIRNLTGDRTVVDRRPMTSGRIASAVPARSRAGTAAATDAASSFSVAPPQ